MDIVVLGLAIGMADALLAVGLVLIYKANRVINLAHGELGAFTVAMMFSLTVNAGWNYWAALGTSLAATAVLAAGVERVILRRLFRSPRLILMIATIGVGQVIIVTRLLIPKPQAGGRDIFFGGAGDFPVPFHFEPIPFGNIVLHPGHILALIVGPLLALGVFAFLRWSPYGIALRAAAENAPRARLLGIPVRRVSTIAWVVAGVLSGVGGVMLAPVIGFSSTEAIGLTNLMRGLAAATVARMESVGIAFGVGLGLAVVDQLAFFWTGQSGITTVILFAVIAVVLIVRRRATARAGSTSDSSWESVEPVRPLPLEITRHPRWRAAAMTWTVAGVAALVAMPFVLGPSSTFLLATVLLLAGVAVSMTVLAGWAGQMSLGQWAIAGVGGVLGSQLVVELGFPFWGGFAAAAVAGGVVALLLGLPALRLEGSALAVMTLGFAVMAESWLFDQDWLMAGDQGIFPRPLYLTIRWYFYVGLAFLVLAVTVMRALGRSRIGRNMVAVRDNPAQAQAMGISVVRTKLGAFAISGVLAAAAGFLWSAGLELADGSIFPAIRSLTIVAAVVIGGLGSISGAILGALYIRAIPYWAADISPNIGLATSGFGLLILLLFLPGGLARILFGARDLLARWLTGIDPRPTVEPESNALRAPAKGAA
jgi:branched-chain amino acid transport system permease protein